MAPTSSACSTPSAWRTSPLPVGALPVATRLRARCCADGVSRGAPRGTALRPRSPCARSFSHPTQVTEGHLEVLLRWASLLNNHQRVLAVAATRPVRDAGGIPSLDTPEALERKSRFYRALWKHAKDAVVMVRGGWYRPPGSNRGAGPATGGVSVCPLVEARARSGPWDWRVR